ncbi:TPA_inf: ORF1p [Capsicum annuum amalgavirus 1]|uniref:ORF1p n=1 Tax=Capsicum annuum amalgavirus 1 TaxID=2069320 RepID=UPI000DAAD891|nr:ORF1p [Capsicum annuum amalgavirus 1]DAB41676.1 TPA_inf: ORF1p [Capsicum annuum amalgavirus 1]
MSGTSGPRTPGSSGVKTVPLTAREKEIAMIEEIDEIGVTFIELGVSAAFFDSRVYTKNLLLPAQYLRLLRQFKGKDAGEVELIFSAAIAKKQVRASRGIGWNKWIQFLNWAKSPAGHKAIQEVMNIEKLERRGGGDFTVDEVAALNLFDVQRNDWIGHQKEARAIAEHEIAELQRKINLRRDKLDEDLREIADQHRPVSGYVPLTDAELNLRCWNFFRQAHEGVRGVGVHPTMSQMKEAFDTYSVHVAKRARVEYMRHGDHVPLLQEYINQKIAHFDAVGDKRQVRHLSLQLAGMGYEVDGKMGRADEGEADEGHPGGDVEPEGEPDPLLATFGTNPDEQVAGEEGDLIPPGTSTQQDVGVQGRVTGPVTRQRAR